VNPLVEVRVNVVDAVPWPEIFTSVALILNPGVAARTDSAADNVAKSAKTRNRFAERITITSQWFWLDSCELGRHAVSNVMVRMLINFGQKGAI
jgi:hypothetical protein